MFLPKVKLLNYYDGGISGDIKSIIIQHANFRYTTLNFI